MTQTVTVTRAIRCPVEESTAFVTDPHKLLSNQSTLSRCRFIESCDEGELWDVYLDSGAVHLGGRVLIAPPDGGRLHWESVRGTRQTFEALVEPDGENSRLTLSLTFSVTGLGVAWLSEMLGRGLVGRNLEAIAEEIRHHLEFEI
jgi:Polyketide cyclase / dehydrase and lipid transport